ncbi:hypothetical protein ACVWYN_002321 [Pedobacter sp. UYP24]
MVKKTCFSASLIKSLKMGEIIFLKVAFSDWKQHWNIPYKTIAKALMSRL